MICRTLLSFCCRMLRCERGDPIIEFIFIVPLMLILGFGVMEVARILWYQHSITKGVRDGTRYLTRVPLVGVANDCGSLNAAAEATAIELAQRGTYWAIPAAVTATLEEVPNNGTFSGPSPLCTVRMTAIVEIPFPILNAFLKTGPSVSFAIVNQARHIGQ
jgi:hypothetical protein